MAIKLGREQLKAWFGPENGKYSKQARFGFARKLRDLAPWWLAPDELTFLDSVARELGAPSFAGRPCLPDEPGCCWVLALVEQNQNLLRLRSAVVLPLRWRNDRHQHDARLPANLTQLANQVALQLEKFLQRGLQAGLTTWTLHFAVEKVPDLSRVPIEEQSAWGSLAGGLILAVEGIRPRQDVWATVAGDALDIRAVELGPEGEKLQTAREFGATTVFVPYQVYEQARKLQGSHLDLAGIKVQRLSGSTSGHSSVETLLRPYLSALRREPSGSDDFEARKRYYLYLEDRRKARLWFYERLLRDVVTKVQTTVASVGYPKITDLAILASVGMEIIPVLCGVFRPQRLWVRYDPGFLETLVGKDGKEKDLLDEVESALDKLAIGAPPDVKPIPLPHSTYSDLSGAFRQFFQEKAVDSEHSWMIDVTLGTSLMSVCLYEAAFDGVWVAYVRNETEPVTDRRFVKTIECWQKRG
jgi:hypothetical protein